MKSYWERLTPAQRRAHTAKARRAKLEKKHQVVSGNGKQDTTAFLVDAACSIHVSRNASEKGGTFTVADLAALKEATVRVGGKVVAAKLLELLP